MNRCLTPFFVPLMCSVVSQLFVPIKWKVKYRFTLPLQAQTAPKKIIIITCLIAITKNISWAHGCIMQSIFVHNEHARVEDWLHNFQ